MFDALSSHRGVAGEGVGPVPYWLLVAVLVLDLLVVVFVLRSRKRFLVKLAWIALIFFLPVLGLLIYFVLGREKP